MPREKEHYREVVADIYEATGKRMFGVNDIRAYLGIGYNKAIEYLGKNKQINIYQFASKLLK
ncbi:MAG: hypothetical protein IKY39_01850 [Clostridia bacterium]|nr:hypothetical protein [Clostridia bacterium]